MTTNAYWDAVLEWATGNPFGQMVLGWRFQDLGLDQRPMRRPSGTSITGIVLRQELVQRYAFTISAPDTVAFVAEHAGPAVIDPMASTGWWASLLAAAGADVYASDLQVWPGQHTPVAEADGVDAVLGQGDGRTLLLSWPPWRSPIGAALVDAYPGDRIVYMGELWDGREAGNCGDERMLRLLGKRWRAVAVHEPATWAGLHDMVVVYDRKKPPKG